ncbi:GAD-like domain-containing protein [Isoptericola jiangsuensis]|uniref:GAD-like domain-containing protein n=1 Tax=Isoptericola jiangsuensis TaxID=548579 RepID=UPI003866B7A4
MTSTALCLSVALQLPVTTAPLTLDPDSLATLRQALQAFGEFQQPYSAPVDAYEPDAGAIDAAVEVSAGCVHEGPAVIILDDDAEPAPRRYLVLETPWHELPTGALLLVDGSKASAIPAQGSNPELARTESMLTFLDLLSKGPEARDHRDTCTAITDTDASASFVTSLLDQLRASTPGSPAADSMLTLWKGRFPDALLALWQRDGLARYHDDRLALVDPARYDAVLAAFLAGTPIWGKDDFHVYAISPFGQLLICGEQTGVELTLEPHEGYLCAPAAVTLPTSSVGRNRRLHDFLLTLDDPELDVLAEDGEPMFWRAREMLGPLCDGEIYTSMEPVSERGWRMGSLVKRQALDVLAELAQRR